MSPRAATHAVFWCYTLALFALIFMVPHERVDPSTMVWLIIIWVVLFLAALVLS